MHYKTLHVTNLLWLGGARQALISLCSSYTVQPRLEQGQRQLHDHPAAFDPGEAERPNAVTGLHLVDIRVQHYSLEVCNFFCATLRKALAIALLTTK
jgi:hypothetical protein